MQHPRTRREVPNISRIFLLKFLCPEEFSKLERQQRRQFGDMDESKEWDKMDNMVDRSSNWLLFAFPHSRTTTHFSDKGEMKREFAELEKNQKVKCIPLPTRNGSPCCTAG